MRLTHWLIDSSIYWFVDSSIYWFIIVYRFINSLMHWCIDWLIDSSIHHFIDSSFHRFSSSIHWFINFSLHRLVESLVHWSLYRSWERRWRRNSWAWKLWELGSGIRTHLIRISRLRNSVTRSLKNLQGGSYIHLFVYSFICLFVYSFIRLFVYKFILLLVY